MPNTTVYSMLSVSVTVDGQQVTGFADGDNAVQVSHGSDIGQMVVGAGGDSIFSQSADRSATITLRLQHTSPTHRLLLQKTKAQRAGRIVGFPVVVNDSALNEGGQTDKCFVQTAPDDQKGKNASAREWVLITGDWTPNVTNGA